MLAWALSSACSRMGSRPTLPDTTSRIRPRWACPFLRSQLRKPSVACLRSPNSSIRSTVAADDFLTQFLTRVNRPRACREAAAISTTASSALVASSRSTNTVSKSPLSPRRRSNSRTRLVFPIRRCAVTSVWIPSSTRSMSASISTSRLKKRFPATQFPPAFRKTIPFPIRIVGNDVVGNNNVGNSSVTSRPCDQRQLLQLPGLSFVPNCSRDRTCRDLRGWWLRHQRCLAEANQSVVQALFDLGFPAALPGRHRLHPNLVSLSPP